MGISLEPNESMVLSNEQAPPPPRAKRGQGSTPIYEISHLEVPAGVIGKANTTADAWYAPMRASTGCMTSDQMIRLILKCCGTK